MVYGHRFNIFSINLVKLHNTPQIGGLTTIKSLFLEKRRQKKVPNLFALHRILVKDATMY